MRFSPESVMANVWLCALAWCFSLSGMFVQISTTTLFVKGFQGSAVSTVPVGIMMITLAVFSILFPTLLKKMGYLPLAVFCSVSGLIGSAILLAVTGTEYDKTNPDGAFAVVCVSALFFGPPSSFGSMIRFVVMKISSDDFRPVAVSISISGGILSVIFGPLISMFTRSALAIEYLGSYFNLLAVYLAFTLAAISIRYPEVHPVSNGGAPERNLPKKKILWSDKRVLLAIWYQTVSYASMAGQMTAVPLAMSVVGLTFEQSSIAIMVHIVGMFAPSMFGLMGKVIRRCGQRAIIFAGFLLAVVGNGIFFAGQTFEVFVLGIAIIGVAWSMTFVASNARYGHLLKSATERQKLSGWTDCAVWGSVAVCTATGGIVIASLGWFPLVGMYMAYTIVGLIPSLYELLFEDDEVESGVLPEIAESNDKSIEKV